MKICLKLLISCTLGIFCLFACAEQMDTQEVIMGNGVEAIYFHGPIPVELSSAGENDISQEQALQIAQEVVLQDGMVLKETLEQCLRSVHYVILSNLEDSYHIGGWVVTYFLTNSYEDLQTVIMEGASGKVLFTARGTKSGISWLAKDHKKSVSLGSQNFLWPIEWNAVYDTVFGLPSDTYTYSRDVLPTENDISQAAALGIAKEAIWDIVRDRGEELGISAQDVEKYEVAYKFVSGWEYYDNKERTDDTVWIVTFYSAQLDEWGYKSPICTVIISSTDGEVCIVAVP